MSQCQECNDDFESARSRRYCSKVCSNRAGYRLAQETRLAARSEDPPSQCPQCGELFKSPRGRLHCSRRCKSAAYRVTKAKGVVKVRTWTPRLCKECGRPFLSRLGSLYCTETCRLAYGRHPSSPFDCIICGTRVVPGQGGHHWLAHRYCSPKCRRRASRVRQKERGHARMARDRRRALKKGAFVANVSSVEIFKRDGWRCKLCGGRLHRRRRVPHPQAPTVDHIIPLAAGGTHESANCQAAHFLCNSIKGNRAAPSGDQLLLIG